jgi:hypothetical protein
MQKKARGRSRSLTGQDSSARGLYAPFCRLTKPIYKPFVKRTQQPERKVCCGGVARARKEEQKKTKKLSFFGKCGAQGRGSECLGIIYTHNHWIQRPHGNTHTHTHTHRFYHKTGKILITMHRGLKIQGVFVCLFVFFCCLGLFPKGLSSFLSWSLAGSGWGRNK